jgi:putative RNA 2'-phosphotransferase
MEEKYTLGQKAIYLLRHQKDTPVVTDEGWVVVDELLAVVVADGYSINKDELIEKLKKSNRAEFTKDLSNVRATHGHSNGVHVKHKSVKPPEVLYHGTGIHKKLWIEKLGLKQKSRFVYLTPDLELAKGYAKERNWLNVVYRISAMKMYDDGFEFYLSTDNVWLTKEVPPRYLKVT